MLEPKAKKLAANSPLSEEDQKYAQSFTAENAAKPAGTIPNPVALFALGLQPTAHSPSEVFHPSVEANALAI